MQNICWKREADFIKVSSIEEGQKLLEKIKKTYTLAEHLYKRCYWYKDKKYFYKEQGYWSYLHVKDKTLKVYTWNNLDDKKNASESEGPFVKPGQTSAFLVNKTFKARTGKTLKEAFGYSDLRDCVPKPFYYINSRYKCSPLTGVSKADFSSNYPSHFIGKLPTTIDSILVSGVAEPTEEYPFAFYIKSGHCAEYQKFDTRLWSKYPIMERICTNELTSGFRIPKYLDIEPEQEQTLLCKASEYELTEEMLYFYNIKNTSDKDSEEYNQAKLVMNAFIGYLHPKGNRKSFKLFHLAAVCIARANQKMLETCLQIGTKDILQVIVDGIIYFENGFECQEKDIGNLVKEIESKDFCMRSINQYMFRDNDKIIDFKLSGYEDAMKDKITNFENLIHLRGELINE